jgi:hypothetical protein
MMGCNNEFLISFILFSSSTVMIMAPFLEAVTKRGKVRNMFFALLTKSFDHLQSHTIQSEVLTLSFGDPLRLVLWSWNWSWSNIGGRCTTEDVDGILEISLTSLASESVLNTSQSTRCWIVSSSLGSDVGVVSKMGDVSNLHTHRYEIWHNPDWISKLEYSIWTVKDWNCQPESLDCSVSVSFVDKV